ncbi:tudor and KH domain-containing protein homolog [Neocloeon triangulifer]|uniref:tudor and KH domain-containing protein homolog n=1 Tax=Neocloeon triangulifer TaxID=2078957 RepID=UPI00286F3C44|nr:tudor and KH domain-containing protein homolog [Neocloeon triangulifer]
MMKPVTAAGIALGASLVGAGALALYFLLREDEDRLPAIGYVQGSRVRRNKDVIDVFIPEEKVAVFIGRAGSNLRDLETRTKTIISYKTESKDGRFVIYTIQGKADRVAEAETVISEFLACQPDLRNIEIIVPKMALGRILGRENATLLNMQQISGAKIKIDEKGSKTDDVVVSFHGTCRQISLAKSLVEEKVEEDRELREGILQRVRSPRSPARQFCITNSPYKDTSVTGSTRPVEKLNATTMNGFLEVFVSAAKDPGRFWIQKVGPASVELDKLVDKMTEFYNQEENLEVYKPKEAMDVGALAAAQFSVDGKWYRAFVKDVVVDDYDPLQSKLDVFFVDYGDDETKVQSDVYNLNSQFLRLRHQAIECTLAGIVPNGGVWTEEATDLFAELTYASRWKVVMAKVQGFREQPKERASSPIPQVVLVDTSGPEDVDVAVELVKHGFANRPLPKKPGTVIVPAGEEDNNSEDGFFE